MSIILINDKYLPLLNRILINNGTTGEEHLRAMLKDHLKRLDSNDRYYRFFNSLTDFAIDGYVDRLDFSKDSIFVKFDKTFESVIGLLHVAKMDGEGEFEIGVSVDVQTRGTGLGYELFARAVTWADDLGAKCIYVNCLSKNRAMQRIAERFKMTTKSIDYETKEGELMFDAQPNLFGYLLTNTMNKITLYDMAARQHLHKVLTAWQPLLNIGQKAS